MGKEIDAKTVRMISADGFMELFWEELTEAQKKNPYITRAAIFHELNKLYEDTFGTPRYSNWDSFRRRLAGR